MANGLEHEEHQGARSALITSQCCEGAVLRGCSVLRVPGTAITTASEGFCHASSAEGRPSRANACTADASTSVVGTYGENPTRRHTATLPRATAHPHEHQHHRARHRFCLSAEALYLRHPSLGRSLLQPLLQVRQRRALRSPARAPWIPYAFSINKRGLSLAKCA
jgi:hypothetical protein